MLSSSLYSGIPGSRCKHPFKITVVACGVDLGRNLPSMLRLLFPLHKPQEKKKVCILYIAMRICISVVLLESMIIFSSSDQ